MKKVILFTTLFLTILCGQFAVAVGVDAKTATRAAETFTSARNGILSIQAIRQGKPPGEAIQYTISNTTLLIDEQTKEALAYIMHLKPNGFIAMSTDTAVKPIVAFSFNSNFIMDENPNNILYRMLKMDMRYRLLALPLIDEKTKNQNKDSWNKYLADPVRVLESQLTTQQWPDGDDDGWLDTTWQQSGIYNDSCPPDPTTANQCLTGCVATAMAQIINYWEFPNAISFSDGDNYRSVIDPDGSGTEPQRRIWIDVDPDGLNDGQEAEEYEYDPSMSSINYNENGAHPSDQTIADLMFACGVSVEMGYSDLASGAATLGVATALTVKFGYDSAGVMDPDHYPNFYDVLENNMKNGEPGQLAIRTNEANPDDRSHHSIVCDGYRDDGTYHLNFGWGSSNPDNISQAWYSLPTGMPSGYSVVKYGVVNIKTTASENNDPLLYNGWVYPRWQGTTATDFEYVVDYHDVDGDPPAYVRVHIDGIPYSMDFVSGSGTPASGQYHYVTNLSVGTHNFSFETEDVRGGYYQTGYYYGPDVDIPPPGSFEILDCLINDSYELASYNNQDGIIHSGEVIGVRPRIKYDESASVTATRIDITLSSDNSSLEVWTGDRRYPDMSPGDIRYPKDGKYIRVIIDKNCYGTFFLDADLEWEEGDITMHEHFPDAIQLNIQPAPWLLLINKEWDFGVVKPGDIVNYSLTVSNIGTEVLQISSVEVPGDTTAVPSSFSLAAGASQNIDISIDTSSIQSGTRISRDIHVISNGRTENPTQDEHLIISGLVSDKVAIFQVPNVTAGLHPDISGDYIVWKDGRNGNFDIFAYNITAGTELQIATNPSNQYEPLISGDLIVWTDARNWDGSGWTPLYDIYGYDLGTGQEYVISDDPEKEILIGVDGNLVAFARAYEILEDWVEKQIAYNLLVYEYQGNGQFIQRYTTGFVPGSGYQTRQSIDTDGDFGGGLLVFESYEWYWHAEYEYWLRGDKHVEVFDFLAGDTNPHRELDGWYNPYSATTHRFVFVEYYEDANGYSGDQVWIWDNGSVRRITSPGSAEVDHGGDCLAISGDLIVYDKWAADALFYWDLSTEQESLLTDEVNNAYDSRMDDNTVVWEAEGHIYFAFVQTPDIEVSPANIAFSDEYPIEDDTIDISAVIRNVADYDCTQDITVRLYDGDPNDPNTQLGSDEIISGGIGARSSTTVEFNDISVGVEGSHNIYACINVSFIDNPVNNKAYKTLIVGDADTQGPETSNVVVQEFNGNGDGRIEDDEQILISWQATDISGINSSWCTIDANDYPASGTYYVIVGPYQVGNYDFIIFATDGDISPETSQYSDEFTVSIAGDISEDGKVNYEDLGVLADQWLQPPGTPSADIAPSPVDGLVNFLDFAVLAKHWLEGTAP